MITKWSELPMGKFQEIQKIDDEDPVMAAVKLNAILNDKTIEEVLNAPITEVVRMSASRRFLEKPPVQRITRKRYVLGDKAYVFDGNPYRITTAQFIDLEQLADKTDVISALSIFLIPEGFTYNKDYDIEDVKADISKYLSAEEGLSMANFFTTALALLERRAVRRARKILKQAKKQGIPTQEAEQMLTALERERRSTRG